MKVRDYIIRGFKKTYQILFQKVFYPPICIFDRQESNDLIYQLLNENKPIMISRFGTTEINTINNYQTVNARKPYFIKCFDYITDKTHTPWWNTSHFEIMSVYSGIFPANRDTAEKFSIRSLSDIPLIDLLGCHQYYEKFMPLSNKLIQVQLEMLYPFFVDHPWTRVLKGKKVLVIHPFEETIRLQYEKRNKLFENPDVLPDFELLTYKAVQSVAGNKVPYQSWFEALKKMEDDISLIDFDYALIGCGAYGMPLAAYIKRMGKKAIHIGGGLQLMFGILGNRWTRQYEKVWNYRPGIVINTNYKVLFNDYWIYPVEKDTPINSYKVEDNCYWK